MIMGTIQFVATLHKVSGDGGQSVIYIYIYNIRVRTYTHICVCIVLRVRVRVRVCASVSLFVNWHARLHRHR